MYKMTCKCGHSWSDSKKNLKCGKCDCPARDVKFECTDTSVTSTHSAKDTDVKSVPSIKKPVIEAATTSRFKSKADVEKKN